MNKRRNIRVLIADDEGAIIRIYSIGLQHYFAPQEDSSLTVLEGELFGEEGDDRPSAEITVCQQGVEAVQLTQEAAESGAPFDVVVLDIRMPPGIDGMETAQQIRASDPSMPILFVSGFSDFTHEELQEKLPPASCLDLIEKPVQLARLASKIKRIAR